MSMFALSEAGENKVEGAEESKKKLKELYEELIQIDPLRKGYYQDALAGNAGVLIRP